MDNLTKAVLRSVGQVAQRERRQGNHGKANGIVMITFGIFLLPIPIIGLPLILYGIKQMRS